MAVARRERGRSRKRVTGTALAPERATPAQARRRDRAVKSRTSPRVAAEARRFRQRQAIPGDGGRANDRGVAGAFGPGVTEITEALWGALQDGKVDAGLSSFRSSDSRRPSVR